MRKIFDDSDEEMFFATYLANALNKQIDEKAEKKAVQPVIHIKPSWVSALIREYEKG